MVDLMTMNVRLMLILLRYTLHIQRFTNTKLPTKNNHHTVGKFMARPEWASQARVCEGKRASNEE